jgi:hypothetical protein
MNKVRVDQSLIKVFSNPEHEFGLMPNWLLIKGLCLHHHLAMFSNIFMLRNLPTGFVQTVTKAQHQEKILNKIYILY